MRARLAEIVVETSVGDVKIKKVICLHKKKVSKLRRTRRQKYWWKEIRTERGFYKGWQKKARGEKAE